MYGKVWEEGRCKKREHFNFVAQLLRGCGVCVLCEKEKPISCQESFYYFFQVHNIKSVTAPEQESLATKTEHHTLREH